MTSPITSPSSLECPHVTLLLGGVRSGKSAKAVALASEQLAQHKEANRPDPVLFVATAQAFDDEMAARIELHRQERPSNWATLESQMNLAADIGWVLEATKPPYMVVIIDCITVWVSNILLSLNDDDDAESRITDAVTALIRLMTSPNPETRHPLPPLHWILVTNEVGLGVVPPTPLGRRYRDALGRANQLLAAAADDVKLMVAGLSLALKN